MSRSKAILSNENYTRERTFSKYIGGGSSYRSLEIMDPSAEEFYKAELEKTPMIKSNWGSNTKTNKDYSGFNLNAINKRFLRAHRPQLDNAVIDLICGDNHGYNNSEARSLSAFMLNEFLGQDEFFIYHDFLNAKWDDFYELSTNFQVTQFPHTAAVYSHYNSESPFTFRLKTTKKIRMVLENLTKPELLNLVTKTKYVHVVTSGIEFYFANQLKLLAGELERQMSPLEATNQLLRAFSVSLLAGGFHSNLKLTEVYKNITEIVESLSYRIARDSVNYTASQITPNDLGKIGTFLENNGEEFTIAEMFFVIYSLANHKVFSRTGTTADIAGIYLEFLARDNALEIFKMIGELGQSYEKQLPTFTQWKKGFANGDLDFIMGSDITALLIAASDVDASQTGELRYRRALFGGKIL